MKTLSRSILVGLGILVPAAAGAETFTAGPGDDVEGLIGGLGPGDELVLQEGEYVLTERFSFDIAGSEGEEIVIRAADGASVLFHRAEANQNIWDFSARWTTIRGLRFSGGSAGLRVEGAEQLTIEECEIFDTEDVALRMNNGGVTYESVRIVRNHIHDTSGTGEGMYLGCNEDGCRLANAVIAENWVHHTNGPGVSQGDGIELKEGSYGVVIRDNVVHDTNYPCVLTYSTAGNGEANVIERNAMWNCGDHGIQTAGDAIIRNNIVLGAANAGIASQPHQNSTPGNLQIVHNTIVNSGPGITVRDPTGDVVVANNAVYSEGAAALFGRGDVGLITVVGNVGVGGLDGFDGGLVEGDLALDFVGASYGPPPNDVFPAPGGGLVGGGDVAYVTMDDFNGVMRAGVADVGAYAFADSNPGWELAPEFKELEVVDPPADMGGGPADMGVGGDMASSSPDTGESAVPDAGGREDGGPGASEEERGDGGCCSTASRGPGRPVGWLLLIGVVILRRRRRGGIEWNRRTFDP